MPKKQKNKNQNVYALPTFDDGFFTQSVASQNEATGYAVTIPESDGEASEISSLVGKAMTSSKKSKRNKDGSEK